MVKVKTQSGKYKIGNKKSVMVKIRIKSGEQVSCNENGKSKVGNKKQKTKNGESINCDENKN